MKRAITRLAAGAALLANSAVAVLVTSSSSCAQQCGNVLSATTPADIQCDQNSYSSGAGLVFKNCLNCELTSTAYDSATNQSDQQWLLYNSRYALSECLFGQPGNDSAPLADISPCITSRACGPFQAAFAYGNFGTSTSIGAYDYCGAWQDADFYDGCVDCLRAADGEYLGNMVRLLQAGCDQQPAPGAAVSVAGTIFSTTLLNETTPTLDGSWTSLNSAGALSLGAIVGIAIGALCVVLAVAGFCIVCNGRRRRRAFLRRLEMRQKEAGSGWPHPFTNGGGGGGGGIINRGADMNETPLSQKPLRGWDNDSPESATASEPSSYGRYFSPYASQQTSPVNGGEQHMHNHNSLLQQWPHEFHDEPMHNGGGGGGFPASAQEQDYSFPSSSQEKAMQSQHEAATTTAAAGTTATPMHIGLALGGDEPSLRSKASAASSAQREGGAPDDGGAAEAYELREVSSSSAGGSSAGGMNSGGGGASSSNSNSFRNRLARENRAPVLRHPGYGRYSPERMLPPPPPPPPVHSMSGGGLVDEGDHRV